MTPECSSVSEQMWYGKEVKCSRKREINTQKKKVPWLGLGFSWSHSRVREAIPYLCCCRGCMRKGLDRESQVISHSSSTDKHQLLNTHYGGPQRVGHDWVTELNWTEAGLKFYRPISFSFHNYPIRVSKYDCTHFTDGDTESKTW